MPGIDPPIIISGGGGDNGGGGGGGGGPKPPRPPIKRPTRNVIQINCEPENIGGPRRFRTKVNKDAEITSVLIEFPGMDGQKPITISGYDVYNIKVTFNTDTGSARTKPKPAPVRKAKKAAAKKRPTTRKQAG